ncbi:magnesium transporter [Yunchengibacter salinarum]|uniref:magnesium transporter n=1 Tax=Yunchengibacter salinarum TaxID=3133399 RepID=UPI0035B58B35
MVDLDEAEKSSGTGTEPPSGDDGDNKTSTDIHLSRDFINALTDAVEDGDPAIVRGLVAPLHAADMADVLEVLSSRDRLELIRLIGDELDASVLYEVEGEAQDELYEHIPNAQIADAMTELETDQAVYVLEEMGEADRNEILRSIAADDRLAIEDSLSHPEDSAGRLMQRNLIALPEFWTVGQTIDFLRNETDTLPDTFYDIFIVDPAHHPRGTVPLSRIMRTRREETLGTLMDEDPHVLQVSADQEEVAYQFAKYHLISAAVVDEAGRLVGVVTVDDVVDVIGEEAREDILGLAGAGAEATDGGVLEVTRSRFTWLVVNMATAVAASMVIGAFEASIQQMVALAVLMPIVASMGGNAGTQTMALTVRAIATKDLSAANAMRVFNRELVISLLNGVSLAILAGVLAHIWFGNPLLSWVFAAAMVVNVIVAGLSGLLVPVSLHKLGMDPALASTVFVTTITDVVGFFAFLGLAALVLF